MPNVVPSISEGHIALSDWWEGVSSAMAASLTLPVRDEVTRLIPYGARIDVFLVDDMDWRISVIHGYLCSSACHLRFHGVANVKPDGCSLLGHRYALGPM